MPTNKYHHCSYHRNPASPYAVRVIHSSSARWNVVGEDLKTKCSGSKEEEENAKCSVVLGVETSFEVKQRTK